MPSPFILHLLFRTRLVGRMPPPSVRPRAVLFFTVFLDLAGFGMILPLLPFYAERFGASPFEVGVLFAGYSFAQAICAPLLGQLSDRVGRRPVLLVAIAANALAHLLFAAGRTVAVLLVARIASGAASANYSIAQAYVADVTPAADRAKGLGLIGAALGLGFVLGPGIGGLLSLISQVAVPLGAAALGAVNLVLVTALLPESHPPEERLRPETPRPPFTDLGEIGRPAGKILGLYFLVVVAFSAMEATLALYCERRFEFGVAETSWLLVMVGVVIAAVQGGLVGRLVPSFGERRLVLLGIGTMAVGLVGLPFAPTVAGLVIATAVLGVGSGLHNPSLLGLLSRMTSASKQGSTLGYSRTMGALARTAGPIWGGWVFQQMGPSWPFWIAGGLMVLTLPVAHSALSPMLGE